MTNKELREIIKLENLHRYVFDNLYIQNCNIENEEYSISYLNEYKALIEKYPNFRYQCADAFICFYEQDNLLGKIDRKLPDEELILLIELSKINFNRYSLENNIKKRIKEIKKDV